MTPLAHRIVKELTLPLKRRTFADHTGLQKRMQEIHCFECTDVYEAAAHLAQGIVKSGIDARSSFLPFPKTWVEYQHPRWGRLGFLLEEVENGALVTEVWGFSSVIQSEMPLSYKGIRRREVADLVQKHLASEHDSRELLLAFLALINTPRLINRTTVHPHRGLEKALAEKRALIGHWPLLAWSTIKLSIAPPRDMGDSIECHLTGERALHWVKSFLRVRMGFVEIVRAHQRGSAAKGIKQQRYEMVA